MAFENDRTHSVYVLTKPCHEILASLSADCLTTCVARVGSERTKDMFAAH